jgi:DNA-binding MarR family transcriptional regulator
MSNLKKYFNYLDIVEKSNREHNLTCNDALLLDAIARANDEGRTLNANDLLLLTEIGSQATIHARLKHLVSAKLISFHPNESDGGPKEARLTELAHKRYETLSQAFGA